MKLHTYKSEQLVKAPEQTVWNFFSLPDNLARITPPGLNFNVTSPAHAKQIYAGMIISYSIRPLFNIRMKWITEITHCNPPRMFIDEQRFGPYKFWHHEHVFTPHKEGVIMKDTVHYAIGFGWPGELAHTWLIRPKLKEIFDYRQKKIEELFNQ